MGMDVYGTIRHKQVLIKRNEYAKYLNKYKILGQSHSS